MANQLLEAVSKGHDAQLHLHPQWIDAKPIRDDCWQISRHYWRLSQVPNGLGDRKDFRSLRGLFYLGKQTLEELLRPIKPDYECFAFRAGGYCIQPEKNILQAMREEGFRIDSSVTPGRYLEKDYARYDFRMTPRNLSYWKVSNSITESDPDGDIVEVPIFTDRFTPLFRQSTVTKKTRPLRL